MVNLIWAGMIAISVLYAMVNGTMGAVNEAIFSGAKEAVTVSIALISVLVFWLGLMEIAQSSGLLARFSKLCSPIVRRIFPEVPPEHPAFGYILSNMTANMFGLGNAATPLGIKAMEQLKQLNGDKDEASRSMVTFLAINTSSLTLIPTTVIAIRMNYGSTSPTEIVFTTIVATLCSTIAALLIDRWLFYRSQKV